MKITNNITNLNIILESLNSQLQILNANGYVIKDKEDLMYKLNEIKYNVETDELVFECKECGENE